MIAGGGRRSGKVICVTILHGVAVAVPGTRTSQTGNINMIDIVDPTTASVSSEPIDYARRPQSLNGLRIGLVENTKKNSEVVLRKIAASLASSHGMKIEVLLHKAQRAPLKDAQIAELKDRADFAIVGVGD